MLLVPEIRGTVSLEIQSTRRVVWKATRRKIVSTVVNILLLCCANNAPECAYSLVDQSMWKERARWKHFGFTLKVLLQYQIKTGEPFAISWKQFERNKEMRYGDVLMPIMKAIKVAQYSKYSYWKNFFLLGLCARIIRLHHGKRPNPWTIRCYHTLQFSRSRHGECRARHQSFWFGQRERHRIFCWVYWCLKCETVQQALIFGLPGIRSSALFIFGKKFVSFFSLFWT